MKNDRTTPNEQSEEPEIDFDELLRPVSAEDAVYYERAFTYVTVEQNAVDYLDRSVRFLMECEHDPLGWKWWVVAIHGSLYGMCIGSLRGTNPDLVTHTAKSGRKTIPDFDTALARCRSMDDLRMGSPLAEKPLSIDEQEQKAIERLHRHFRNRFEHMPSMSWSIDEMAFAELVEPMYAVVRRLVFEVRAVLVRLDAPQRAKVTALCAAGIEFGKAECSRLERLDRRRGDT